MTSGGYTYVKVETPQGPIWAAAPAFEVALGDEVVVPEGSPMSNFHSKTLERTFELVYFVPAIQKQGAPGAATAGASAANPHGQSAVAAELGTPIEKVQGGHTVAEVFAKRAELAGQSVKVRGQVVKFNAGIMGSNWLHIQDGTGASGTNDLTVTTQATVDKGAIVVVNGTLSIDKDFGAGYQYPAIVENATISVE